jgi:septum site-determining protein MinC
MPAQTQPVSEQRPVIEFKSSSITVPTLLIASGNLPLIAEHLQRKVQQAPDFFKNSPVLLDLHEINRQQLDLDLSALLETVNASGLITAGIRGGTEKHNAEAIAQRIAVFSEPRGGASAPQKQAPNPPSAAPDSPQTPTAGAKQQAGGHGAETKLVTQPIRSGQRVYSAGDLVILAQVSAGAEIMAEGNIHVYNTLRGRALAGVQGNTESRIFCSDLQAELISIAGHYRVSEDLDESVRGTPVQIYLHNHALIIDDL